MISSCHRDRSRALASLDDFITVDRKASVDLYNYVQANYSQRINSYNNNLINQQSDANIALYKRRMESAQRTGRLYV